MFSLNLWAETKVKVGDEAPVFMTQTHDGQSFSLKDRKGKGWTILYFYPKAETPGCTKQACAFRDSLEVLRKENAEVYGISGDGVEALKKFHEHHHLNFTLLADEDAKIMSAYGTKIPLLKISKRWTFVIDPQLKIRAIDSNVDPAKDSEKVRAVIESLQAKH